MKKFVLLLFLLFITFLASAAEPNFAKYFTNKSGCFILYDLKADKLLYRFNEQRCKIQYPPCSTFKVPLALIAFDKQIIQDETTTFKWDGTDNGNAIWNRDTSAADWMRNSVIWYSRKLTPQLGTAVLNDYLGQFKYGNRDTSGGITNFWLDSTLRISPDEQLEFLKHLWRDQLPVTKRSLELTRKIMLLETATNGTVLTAKTGSGHLHPGKNDHLGFGWFIGHIKSPKGEYLFVTNFEDLQPDKQNSYPGLAAKSITKQILTDLSLWIP